MPPRRLLDKLIQLGVRSDTTPSDAKYIILTNTVALIAASVSFLYLFVNRSFQNDPWLQFGPPLLSTVVYATPLWLNQRGHYWFARTSMCVATLAIQLSFVYAFGYVSGNHFYMLPLVTGIALVFPPRQWKTAATLATLALAIFTAIVLAGTEIPPAVPLDPEVPGQYYALALVLSAFIIAFISYYSHRRTVIAEGIAERRSRELSDALTELKTAQAQMIETANQAVLGRVTAGLLHEVNTPLGSIRSAADTMGVAMDRCRDYVLERAEEDASKSRAVLRAIEVSSDVRKTMDAGAHRISSLLEGLRQVVGLDEAEHKLIDVRRGIDGAIALLEPTVGERIAFVRSYPEELPPVVGSPAKLNRAIFSLLQNSVQAIADRGEIGVTVREVAGHVEIEITDDGKGIPASAMEGLFELGLTRKEGRVGLRLGLPTTKKSIEEMGGQFELQSVEGEGTTVRMSLPVPSDL